MKTLLGCSLVGLIASSSLFAAHSDWPQWSGPSKDRSIATGKSINWESLSNAKVAWETNVGIGYSSVSVVDGRAYTMGHDGEGGNETVFCLNAKTGAEIWKFTYPAKLLPAMHVGGPNATPTVSGDAVYTLSKDGQAFCLDAATGETLWSANIEGLLGIKTPTWGYAGSPLVFRDQIIFSAGRVVALDRKTGKQSWISGSTYHPGYATPVLFESGNDPVLTAFDGKGVSLLHALNGEEIARHPFKTQYDMTATDPVVTAAGQIFVSAISQGELLKFDGTKLTSVWEDKAMRNAMNACVLRDGYLYGVDGKHKSSRSQFSCVRLSDGKVVWTKENFGYGTLISVGGTLVVLTESGDLVAVKASQKGYEELGRKKVLDSICWTPPSVSGDRLFVRNDMGRTLSIELP
jgi:outer membrane protein assembly factor BamB